MLPAYGVPKAVAAALQALPAVLPAVALPALRKGDRRTKNSPLVSLEAGRGENQTQTTKIILLFYFNRFSLIEIQNLGTEQIVILGLQFV